MVQSVTTKPLDWKNIHQGQVFQTPLGAEDSWTISFREGYRYEIKLTLGVGPGNNWAEWVMMNRPTDFRPCDDGHRWYHAHSGNILVASAFSVESAMELVERFRVGRDRDFLDIITAAGFKEGWRHTYHEHHTVATYELPIGRKGVLTFLDETNGASVAYDTLRGQWTTTLGEVITGQYMEHGDGRNHPVFWPDSCPDPKAVLAQFAVDVIVPFVTNNRMDHRRG